MNEATQTEGAAETPVDTPQDNGGSVPAKRKPGGQPGNLNGFTNGSNAIDRDRKRTRWKREVRISREFREMVIADMGGAEQCTAAALALAQVFGDAVGEYDHKMRLKRQLLAKHKQAAMNLSTREKIDNYLASSRKTIMDCAFKLPLTKVKKVKTISELLSEPDEQQGENGGRNDTQGTEGGA